MADRLIKANDVVKRILKIRDSIPLTRVERYGFGVEEPDRFGQAMRGGIRKALMCIETAPTVDAVPVIRCKDCEFYDDKEDIGWCKIHSQLLESGVWTMFAPDDYCSLAERREKVETD